MKTKKTIPALSMMLLLSGLIALNVSAASIMGSFPGSTLGVQKVTYVVKINHDVNLAGFNCHYYVTITDDNGNAIAPAQPFRFGQWTYIFKEYSSAAQTAHFRVATMTKDSYSICPDSYNFTPQSLKGPFEIGQTYTFILTPEMIKPGGK